MSDAFNLLLLLGLVAIVALWLKLSRARERAVYEARRQCHQHGLQLLDETVGLRALRVRRVNGLRRIERCYGFEVSIDGHDRESCRLWMLGDAVTSLSLPVTERLPHEQATDRASTSNVLPFRPRQNDRLN
ncbi:DUF3301 domain-containing protein [Rhodanobacter sp. AS-Z3]|uniref:DUF3301 domain-containing protein n=1 Tax=Rhodanobacter sp. AS-Z3 TaxID=3031330 RepID=UPI00247A2837|nr:DUF3301 domain-containing protein [Rhodanobacter sp. AS-Z3]WEN14558.1 DUF3301 domain-containing protein [Rhodanobacter sp. AS-Z3]